MIEKEKKEKVLSFVHAYAEAVAGILDAYVRLEIAVLNTLKIEERPEANIPMDETGFNPKEMERIFIEEIWKRLKESKICPYCKYNYTKEELTSILKGKHDYHMLQHQDFFTKLETLPKMKSLVWLLAGFQRVRKRPLMYGG